jgi:hypothetical protein
MAAALDIRTCDAHYYVSIKHTCSLQFGSIVRRRLGRVRCLVFQGERGCERGGADGGEYGHFSSRLSFGLGSGCIRNVDKSKVKEYVGKSNLLLVVNNR